MHVRTGLARFADHEFTALFDGRRVGLLCNPSSVTATLEHGMDVFRRRTNLRALFAPEHGLWGQAQDMMAIGEARHAAASLPVFSLYGESLASLTPAAAALAEIDLLVFDIQDIGCRYYTFAWTLLLAMRACAQANVEVVVLDRPNPLGGLAIEGPEVEAGYESFVGLCSVPTRHGLTIGELARLLAPTFASGARVTVVPMEGWHRAMVFDDTRLPWVLPSPNMPTPKTAFVYPGMCLLEGTNLSEGRGTTRPFEIFGAPYVDAHRLADALEREALPGVRFRPLEFRPTFHKWAGQSSGGVQVHVIDRATFMPLRTGVAVLCAVHRLWPKHFAWRTEPYEFVADRLAIDVLAGSPRLREMVERGASVAEIIAPWHAHEDHFRQARQPALLYE